jgi:hypothetical protein
VVDYWKGFMIAECTHDGSQRLVAKTAVHSDNMLMIYTKTHPFLYRVLCITHGGNKFSQLHYGCNVNHIHTQHWL